MNDSADFDATAMTRLRRVGEVQVAPCGTWAVVAVMRLDENESRYLGDLWRVSLTDANAQPMRLTSGDVSDRAPCFRRDGGLAFLSNRSVPGAAPTDGDDTRDQVWMLPAGGGEPVRLTDEPLGVSEMKLAKHGDRLIVLADVLPGVAHEEQRARAADIAKNGPSGLQYRRMPVRHWDHWIRPAAPHYIAYDDSGGDRRDLTPHADREHRAVEWGRSWDLSPDGQTLAVLCARPGADRLDDGAIRLIDTDTASYRDIGVIDAAEHYSPVFSPDGHSLVAARFPRPKGACGRPELWHFTVGNTNSARDTVGRQLAPEWDAWPSPQCWTPDSTAVLVTADCRGDVPVFSVDISSSEVTRLTAKTAGGSHSSIRTTEAAGETLVVGIRSRLLHPPEAFRMELEPAATPTLLSSLSGFTEEDGAAIASWDSIEVAGDGGTPIQSFVITPTRHTAPGPALLWIHGGPMGQSSDGWHWRWNPLVPAAAGYVVAMPNPRGSTGVGQQMVNGVWNNEWGAACYRDLMAVTDALAARPEVVGDRIGAMGGSFGGYMTNWIGGNTDRFACLVTHAGLYWLSSFYGTTDYPAYCALENGFTPYEDPAAYDRFSPHRRMQHWKTPTLVIHGDRDFRVPVSEALMLFEGLQSHGVDSELLLFPDENHWILAPRNARMWYERVLEFADAHLRSRE